ncbi:hypothetical protein AVEN_245115-1, partial [Araneus ventricosus]
MDEEQELEEEDYGFYSLTLLLASFKNWQIDFRFRLGRAGGFSWISSKRNTNMDQISEVRLLSQVPP